MRRLTIALLTLALVSWVAWVAIVSNGFSTLRPLGWLILFGAPILGYLLILAMLRTTYWIIQGFRLDTKPSDAQPP
jgi:hypothetical protein